MVHPFEVKKGDWTCPKCKTNVFARKKACWKCQTTRPVGSAETEAKPVCSTETEAKPAGSAETETGKKKKKQQKKEAEVKGKDDWRFWAKNSCNPGKVKDLLGIVSLRRLIECVAADAPRIAAPTCRQARCSSKS